MSYDLEILSIFLYVVKVVNFQCSLLGEWKQNHE